MNPVQLQPTPLTAPDSIQGVPFQLRNSAMKSGPQNPSSRHLEEPVVARHVGPGAEVEDVVEGLAGLHVLVAARLDRQGIAHAHGKGHGLEQQDPLGRERPSLSPPWKARC